MIPARQVFGRSRRSAAVHVLAPLLLFLLALPALAEPSIRGTLSAYAYNRQDTAFHWDMAPAISFTASNLGSPDLRFEATLREFMDIRHQTAYDRELRILRGVLLWTPAKSPWEVRLGQQWLTEGVGRGYVAGAWAKYKVDAKTSVTAYGGARLPYSYSLENKNPDEGFAAGVHAKAYLKPVNVGVSYTYLGKSGKLLYDAVGLEASGRLCSTMRFLGRAEMNIQESSMETAQILAEWTPVTDLRVTGEFRSQTPRIFEDSYFAIFLSEVASTMTRLAVRWDATPDVYVRGGGSTILSDYPDQLYKVYGALGCRWAEAGYSHYLSTDKGTQDGLYAQAQYQYRDQGSVFAGYDFSRGSNADTQPENESHAAYFGASYGPPREISLSARVEQISDLLRKEDWRGLFYISIPFEILINDESTNVNCCGGKSQ